MNFIPPSVPVVVYLFDRVRTQRLWWDDAWATLTIAFVTIFMVAGEIHLQDPGGPLASPGLQSAPPRFLNSQAFSRSEICSMLYVTSPSWLLLVVCDC